MVGTRPDIAYAVGVASKSLENPTEDVIMNQEDFQIPSRDTESCIKYQADSVKGLRGIQ